MAPRRQQTIRGLAAAFTALLAAAAEAREVCDPAFLCLDPYDDGGACVPHRTAVCAGRCLSRTFSVLARRNFYYTDDSLEYAANLDLADDDDAVCLSGRPLRRLALIAI